MRLIEGALFASIAVSCPTFAGQIDGSLFKGGQPVANKDIRLRCEGRTLQSRTTPDGTYRFFVEQSGVCLFEVVDPELTHKIYSYQDPVRYDFDLVSDGNGYLLRRR